MVQMVNDFLWMCLMTLENAKHRTKTSVIINIAAFAITSYGIYFAWNPSFKEFVADKKEFNTAI
jgi:hypothetical protein